MKIEIIDDKKIIITLENGSDDRLTAQELVENVKYLHRSSELLEEIKKKNTHAGEADIDRYDDSDDDYDDIENSQRVRIFNELTAMIEKTGPTPDFDHKKGYGNSNFAANEDDGDFNNIEKYKRLRNFYELTEMIEKTVEPSLDSDYNEEYEDYLLQKYS
jgi:hypothetical protein